MESIDQILSFLSSHNDLYPPSSSTNSSAPSSSEYYTATLVITDLPAPRAVRLLLSLAKAHAARLKLVKGPSLIFSDNRNSPRRPSEGSSVWVAWILGYGYVRTWLFWPFSPITFPRRTCGYFDAQTRRCEAG
ncbi:hypothetical protein BC826DRAFT_967393 [Russula brevipes]|nr:hypothetical protein BC826DRAFT_967393 [Russula brevipes]